MINTNEIEFDLARHALFGDSQRIRRRRDQFYSCATSLLGTYSATIRRYLETRGLSTRSLNPLVHDPVARLDIHEALRALSIGLPTMDFIERLDWYVDRLAQGRAAPVASLLRTEQSKPQALAISGSFVWSDVVDDAPVSRRFEEQFVAECLPNRLVGTVSKGTLIRASAEQVDVVARALDRLSALMPVLMSDLLEHVDVICWAEVGLDGVRMQSGSVRSIPGAVFIDQSLMSDERGVDEALLHEAVHCKLFDIYVCAGILRAGYSALNSPRIDVPWNRTNKLQSNAWPLDQAFAALHVYVHLWLYGLVTTESTDLVRRSRDRAHYLLQELVSRVDTFLDSRGAEMLDWIASSVSSLQVATDSPRHLCRTTVSRFVDGSAGGYGIAHNPTEIVLLNENSVRAIETHRPGNHIPAKLLNRGLMADVD